MIVFDASGSMSGDGWGYASANMVSRIEKGASGTSQGLAEHHSLSPRWPHYLWTWGFRPPMQQHHTSIYADA
jgi:hypothetical protein